MTKDRPHRSELAVPGTNVRAMAKAPTLGADIVFLDLEDAVAPDDKEQARANVIDALRQPRLVALAPSASAINGLDTHWCYRDLVDVVEARGDVLDTVLVPEGGLAVRRGVRGDAAGPDRAAARLGRGPHRHPHPDRDRGGHGQRRGDQPRTSRPARGHGVRGGRLRRERPGTHDEHRRREPRLRGAHRPDAATGAREMHWGDQWHFGISPMVAACRAEGLRPIDGPFGDFDDPDGYRAPRAARPRWGARASGRSTRRRSSSRTRSSRPPEAEVERAERILQAMEEAAKEGKGAVSLDGRLIDAASIRMAENLIRRSSRSRAR